VVSWTGQVFFDQRRLDEAQSSWTEDLRIAEEQLRLHPHDAAWLNALAISHHNLGSLLDLRGDLPGALSSYRRSLALQREIAAADPAAGDVQAEIAATLAYVSNDLERQGDLAGALAERRAHLAILERLAAPRPGGPGDPGRRQDLATARGFVATLLVPLGRWDEARRLYEQGLGELSGLAAQDPENAILQRWLGALHSALGALAVAEGRPAAGLEDLGRAREIFEPLVTKGPADADWRLQLGVCHSRTAAALATLDPARARAEARTALEILAPLLKGRPDDSARGQIAEAEVTLGRTEASLGAPAAARAAWERALAVLAPCPRPLTYWKLLSPSTEALLALGRAAEAKPETERLQRMGYRSAGLEKGGSP
jgi:tetratricopeptide (TPR) repeat protein